MSLLGSLNKSENQEESKDIIYRAGREPLPTGLYPATVELAILKESTHGAVGIELHLDIDGYKYREDIYMTNRNKETYYTREKDGEDVDFPLPGYVTSNELSVVTTGIFIEDQDTEKKTVDLYDKDAGEPIPNEVDMLEEIRNKEIIVGLFLDNDYAQKKNESTGVWADDVNAPEIQRNSINKLFHSEGFSASEIMNEIDEPAFINEWKETYTGKETPYINDKTVSKKRKAAKAGKAAPGKGKPPVAGAKPKTNMFSKKK